MKKPETEVSLATNKGGRPRKLIPDEKTMSAVRGLGQIQATTKECAAFFSVTEPTFLKFKADYPDVAEALEDGKGHGRISLRRTQLKLAEKNAAMAIFLGKNILGQSDRQEITGADGGAIKVDHTKTALNVLDTIAVAKARAQAEDPS